MVKGIPVTARLFGRLALVFAVAITIGCDRVTKHVATITLAGSPDRSYLGDTLRVVYAENTGGFLSLGANLPAPLRTALFTFATGLALIALAVLVTRRHWNGVAALGVTLFVAGGASNWFDRLAHGSVVDFLNVGIGPLRTGIFNVADIAITVGVALFALAEFRPRGGSGEQI
jgi:signal peptidase II